jgi:hypothetical protein
MTERTKLFAEPELLSRKDTAHGRWTVDECRPVRGEPSTNIVDRQMSIPTHDDEQSRCIRAHELMHAKVSPAGDWGAWVNRKIATKQSMIAVEELRVNFLCQQVGFDMKKHLADGGETADGEKLTALKDWGGCVRMAIATAGTASNKTFLTGVRRHNREWGAILLDISKRAVKEMQKAHKKHGNLGSTSVDETSGLSPLGFSHTERIATWVDRLADKSPEEIREEQEEARRKREAEKAKKGQAQDDESADGEEQGEGSSTTHGRHSSAGINGNEAGKMDGNPYTGITPSAPTYSVIPHWGELMIEKLPMPVMSKGSLGKRKIASNVGLRPRRMHRLVTDPQMRIFDKTIKGSGGVVIIDGSGSMSFTKDQLRQIVENAPGATVAVYSDRNKGTEVPNMWIVAEKGKMVAELPEVGWGNGVDFPAIEWGQKQRKNSRTPMVWVTDGGVCGPRQNYYDQLAMQCIDFVKRNGIIVVPHVNDAIAQLKNLQKGEKAQSKFPSMMKETHKRITGGSLE